MCQTSLSNGGGGFSTDVCLFCESISFKTVVPTVRPSCMFVCPLLPKDQNQKTSIKSNNLFLF